MVPCPGGGWSGGRDDQEEDTGDLLGLVTFCFLIWVLVTQVCSVCENVLSALSWTLQGPSRKVLKTEVILSKKERTSAAGA